MVSLPILIKPAVVKLATDETVMVVAVLEMVAANVAVLRFSCPD